jgi:hypothetical protein
MPKSNWEDEYEVREDLRAVARSCAVHKDPERMKKVKALAKKMIEESKAEKAAAEVKIELAEGKDV